VGRAEALLLMEGREEPLAKPLPLYDVVPPTMSGVFAHVLLEFCPLPCQ
jgi:hypothetical protein